MSNEQYKTIIEALADALRSKNVEVIMKEVEINNLKEKLEKAEEQIAKKERIIK